MDGVQVYNIEFLCSTFYVKHKIPDPLLKKIKSELEFIRRDIDKQYWNNNLVGAMEEQYGLNTNNASFYEELEDLVLDICEDTERKQELLNPTTCIVNYNDVYLKSMWINFQKKHEFNPIHTHSGDYSFVLFVDIPFDIKNEKECKNAIRTEEEERLNGVFTFSYPDSASSFPITHRNFDIDRSWEGTMFLFPANLAHSVNPFYTSNDYRVTISGNVIFEFNEEDEE